MLRVPNTNINKNKYKMKGPFSIWAFFGLTLWIDVLTHVFIPKKDKKIDPYNPVREVSVIVPVHNEVSSQIEKTVTSLFKGKYPLKGIILCGKVDEEVKLFINELAKKYPTLYYVNPPFNSKAKKINYVVNKFDVGEFAYVRDCGSMSDEECVEKTVAYFNEDKVAAVTTYGRVSVPRNAGSRAYFYGKAWINEVGRFRKNAQEKRGAVFVICGASTMFRTEVIRKHPMPCNTKTEDTHYTWILQRKGYKIRVADDAVVSAKEVDGENLDGIKRQIKQSYRWSSGTIQCLYREGRGLFKNKKLSYSTILPGVLESVMYALPLMLIPLLLFIIPKFAYGFLIGDTVFSLLGTLIIIPHKFNKTVYHYPQIFFFKYVNAVIFFVSASVVTFQVITGNTSSWYNEWEPVDGPMQSAMIGPLSA